MEDQDITWGTPTLQEYKEYFASPCLNIQEREVMEPTLSQGSVDLDNSFKTLLEQRRQEIEKNAAAPQTPVSSKKTLLDKTWTPFVGRLNDTTLNRSDWEPSDDTFVRMEAMCENTEEEAVLERLLNDIPEEKSVHEQFKEKKPMFGDMTQINEIEAPSMMWEQTIIHANSPKLSPFKIVQRPSTIIEESTICSSNSTVSTVKVSEKNETQESDESVVSIDSTGDSFITAKADITVATEQAYCTAAEVNSVNSTTSSSEDSSLLGASKKDKRKFFRDSDVSFRKVKVENRSENFLDSINVVEVSDDESVSQNENDAPSFNDTFERMDYMLAQVEKMGGAKMNISPKPMSPKQALSPKQVMSPKPTVQKAFYTPGKPHTPTFKKPQTVSKIPQFHGGSATKSNKFDHIVSPIHQYIRNTAENPSYTRHHSKKDARLFDDIDHRRLRETQYFGHGSVEPVDAALPQIATISAAKQQLYDDRTPRKIPGGDKINRLIGKNTPTVVKHEGRLKMHEKGVALNANDTVDQSFADLSLMSGDVSVCVVKNLNRM